MGTEKQNMRDGTVFGMIVYLICYAASFLLARFEHFYLSGAALLAAAAWLYLSEYRRTGNLIHLRGLFALSWVGGQGLACLKLSNLAGTWSYMTWFCFFLAFAGYWVVFEVLSRLFGTGRDNYGRWRSFSGDPVPVFRLICAVTGLSLAAFLVEAFLLGYVPLFVRGVPHAYSAFHLTGVHYITVSSVLVPALTVLFFHLENGRGREDMRAAAVGMTIVAAAIPVLCVSRFQFVFAAALAVITYIALQKQFRPAWLLAPLALLIPVYVLLTAARSHDVEYLNGVFEMKYAQMPIFITQPYMYIANNYDNFNCMVEVLPAHTLGIRSLFPLWALTGLKFFFPQLVAYPIYVDKKELTTLTLFYDAYYDFGWIGVLLLSCLLAWVSWLLVAKLREMRNPLGYLLYAQFAAYLALSFFTAWFSNTTVWFYLILTGLMALYYGFTARRY